MLLREKATKWKNIFEAQSTELNGTFISRQFYSKIDMIVFYSEKV